MLAPPISSPTGRRGLIREVCSVWGTLFIILFLLHSVSLAIPAQQKHEGTGNQLES